jgi:GT2 family glycosyltransferase
MGAAESPDPRVAVVIATRDRPALLAATLTAVRAALRPGDDVVVVDSASPGDATREVATDAGARVVRCDEPGASRARNRGAAVTDADIVAFTDDDCLPDPGWITALAAAFGDPSVGFVTGAVSSDVDGASPVVTSTSGARRFERGADPADFGHGANWACRRDAFEDVGGFDERLGAGVPLRGAEEHDLYWRLLRAGWSGVFAPDAVVVHRAWRTPRQVIGSEFGYGMGAGAFAAKVYRLDRHEGRRVFRRRLWDEGFRLAARLLRRGWERPALTQAVKAVGVAVGAARSTRLRLRDGRYV